MNGNHSCHITLALSIQIIHLNFVCTRWTQEIELSTKACAALTSMDSVLSDDHPAWWLSAFALRRVIIIVTSAGVVSQLLVYEVLRAHLDVILARISGLQSASNTSSGDSHNKPWLVVGV